MFPPIMPYSGAPDLIDLKLDLAVFECVCCAKTFHMIDPVRCDECGESMMYRRLPQEAKTTGSGYDPALPQLTPEKWDSIKKATAELKRWANERKPTPQEPHHDDLDDHYTETRYGYDYGKAEVD